jgi:diguanylate cyclase (GGDEF)-like protein
MILATEKRIKQKGFFFFSILTIVFLVSSVFLGSTHPNSTAAVIVTALTIILILANLLYFHLTKDLDKASDAFLAILCALIPIKVALSHGSGILWIFIFPILASFLKEPKSAIKWISLFTALFSALLILDSLKLIDIFETSGSNGNFRLKVVFVYLSIATLSYLYSKLMKELIMSIQTLAVKDSLTGLFNRAFALFYLEKELEKLKRNANKNLCVAYIDLDNFKFVNDTYGHQTGDKVLTKVAQLIENSFRSSDLSTRIGGDEFLIIFTNCSRSDIEKRLKLLKEAIEREFKDYNLSMSYGLVEAPYEASTSEELIKLADSKMYRFKRENKKGRNP